MNKIQKLGCVCEKPELEHGDYRTSAVGTDETNGRKAEVSILQCKLCQRIWLKYEMKPEKWFKGIIAKKEVAHMKPENAVEYIENLDWYLYGGAYFQITGNFGQGKLDL